MSLVTNDGANATNLDSQKWMGWKRGQYLWNFIPTYPKIWSILMLFDPKTSWKLILLRSDFYSQNDHYNVYYSEILFNFYALKVNLTLWKWKKEAKKLSSGVAKCASRHTRPLQKAPTGQAPPGLNIRDFLTLWPIFLPLRSESYLTVDMDRCGLQRWDKKRLFWRVRGSPT